MSPSEWGPGPTRTLLPRRPTMRIDKQFVNTTPESAVPVCDNGVACATSRSSALQRVPRTLGSREHLAGCEGVDLMLPLMRWLVARTSAGLRLTDRPTRAARARSCAATCPRRPLPEEDAHSLPNI